MLSGTIRFLRWLCLHTPTHTYLYTYLHTHTDTPTHIYIHKQLQTPLHTHTQIHIHTRSHTHTYTHLHTHTQTHTFTHLHRHTAGHPPLTTQCPLWTADYLLREATYYKRSWYGCRLPDHSYSLQARSWLVVSCCRLPGLTKWGSHPWSPGESDTPTLRLSRVRESLTPY